MSFISQIQKNFEQFTTCTNTGSVYIFKKCYAERIGKILNYNDILNYRFRKWDYEESILFNYKISKLSLMEGK